MGPGVQGHWEGPAWLQPQLIRDSGPQLTPLHCSHSSQREKGYESTYLTGLARVKSEGKICSESAGQWASFTLSF